MCKLFCEDPATSQSDEFFGVFDIYISSLSEARAENDSIRRKREEEEKIAKQHQEVIRTEKITTRDSSVTFFIIYVHESIIVS